MKGKVLLIILLILTVVGCTEEKKNDYETQNARNTVVTINEDQFFINCEPTYKGRYWNGYKIEGLLMNSRMVQGIFDDENPETVGRWNYPDTGEWNPDRNTNEFVMAMESWRDHGLLAFTLNLQGGSPMGYGNKNWKNTAFDEKGNLKSEYIHRLRKILNRADELGMVVILGYFYFGQDQFLDGERSVINATRNITNWLLENGYQNVIVELNNECDNSKYDIAILKSERVHELINIVKSIKKGGRRLLVSASFNGNSIPTENVVSVADIVLIHGNGVKDPKRIIEMVQIVRNMESYRKMPIVFNEDDHYNYHKEENNFVNAVKSYASWGYFDFRRNDESFENGFQSVPVDWKISSDRKNEFFEKVKEITGY